MKSIFLFIFLLFISCDSPDNKLPILSYTINDIGVKEYYSISYQGFKNQLGQSITTTQIEGKVIIANFFFTRCPSICPPMRTQLIEVANSINHKDFLILSHTIDSKHDSTNVLKTYSDATGIPTSKWQFLNASETETKLLAKQYMTNFKPTKDGEDFYHSSFIALVDKKQQIRGFYNILIAEEVKRLKTDIEILLKISP